MNDEENDCKKWEEEKATEEAEDEEWEEEAASEATPDALLDPKTGKVYPIISVDKGETDEDEEDYKRPDTPYEMAFELEKNGRRKGEIAVTFHKHYGDNSGTLFTVKSQAEAIDAGRKQLKAWKEGHDYIVNRKNTPPTRENITFKAVGVNITFEDLLGYARLDSFIISK